jgi:two-component system OmpR family response regulator
MRILLLEDDRRLGPIIRRTLAGDGHDVDLFADGLDGLTAALAGRYDVLVLDRRVPRLDGLGVLRALRTANNTTPVLLLTAVTETPARVEGLDAGADDYLTKPFENTELLARVRALGRRTPETGPAVAAVLRVGRLELDSTRHVARVGAAEAELSAREFALLAMLMRHAGETLSRDDILSSVWGSSPDAYANVVDLYVSYLRKKLEPLGADGLLHTARGRGYRLDR